jgi:uncharacterized protein (DUF433 family)
MAMTSHIRGGRAEAPLGSSGDAMIQSTERLLGVGLYSPFEAALYAQVRPQLVSQWLYGRQGERPSEAVLDPQLGITKEKIVTFLDFVQILAIRRVRNERDISLQKIRQAYRRAKEEFDVLYPLATQGVRIGVFGPPRRPDRQTVFICLKKKDEAEVQQYFELSGREHGNQLIGEVVLTYSRFLDFDKDTDLARKFTIFKSDYGAVTMDPEVRFGEPFIEATGYTAYTLFNAYQTEGTIERAASVYDVSQDHIRLAIDFFAYVGPKPAA